MNLSMKWLSDYVTLNTTVKDFCAAMTMSGSKVEVATEEGSEIKNVVVGKLLSVVPHENSDHLVVCQVDVGQEQPIQIVTGAPNVKAGDIVPVALCGAELPISRMPLQTAFSSFRKIVRLDRIFTKPSV